MDGLIALGILLLLALPVITVVSFFMLIGTRRRLTEVEKRLIAMELRAAGGAAVAPAAAEAALPPEEAVAPAPETAQPESMAVAADEPPEGIESAGDTPPAPDAPPAPPRPAKPRESLEQRLGARWAVWVGGLALALGAIFLVRYSIDAGLIGPGVRIALAAAFSIALLAGGEWLRRSPRVTAFSAIPAANIPGILTAAGTVGLFATAYGAYALYGMIGPAMAFLLLAAIGLGTMAAAALHGPWLSGLGLVGAHVAPLLVASTKPDPAILALYLTVVTAAAFGLARLRHWRWLAIAASVAALGWGFLVLFIGGEPVVDAAYAIAFMILALLALVVDAHPADESPAQPDFLATLVLAGAAALLVTGAITDDFGATGVVAALIGGALLLAAAWRYDAAALLSGVAALLLLGLLYFWPAAAQVAAAPTTYVADAVAAWFPLPDAVAFFANVAAIGSAALIAVALLHPRRRPAPVAFAVAALAGAAAAGPLLALAVAYLRISGFTSNLVLAAIAFALAGLYAALTNRSTLREADDPTAAITTGMYAAGAVGGIAFGLTMALDGGMLATALALASLGTAWVETRRPIPALRYAVLVMAAAVFGRIVWNPYVFNIRSGAAVYGSILAGYGIPTLAFAGAAMLLHRRASDRPALAAEGIAITLFALMVVFEIHAVTFGGDLLTPSTRLGEQGLLTAAAFAFSLGLARIGRKRSSPVFAGAAILFRALGLANAVLSLGIALNPLVTGDAVAGSALLNEIVLAYWLPAILAGLLALQPLPAGATAVRRWLRLATGFVALALAFGGVSLEIRFLFAMSRDLSAGGVGAAESYTYSAVWLAMGLALLLAGLFAEAKAIRIASAALILIAVLKVFLIDMGNLEGVWRALSFMGLGLVLIGIGLLYQRLLFGRRQAEGVPGG